MKAANARKAADARIAASKLKLILVLILFIVVEATSPDLKKEI